MGFLGFGKDTLGEVPVPGEGTVELPAGEVSLRYVEDRDGRGTKPGSGKPWAGPGPDLRIELHEEGGAPVVVKPPRSVRRGMGRAIHQEVGSAEIPSPGPYVVTVAMTVEEEHRSPRLELRA